ncbi:MAG: RagB/SusD family nutrient uptake outer membrane protein [Chloroflexia bacterium]|nr:RagB/SusD family nutrient uptake outer membrane protein [Chloroflexia bacterium]
MPKEELNAGFADANSEWMWALDMREDDNGGYLMVPSFYDLRTSGYNSFRADSGFYNYFEPSDSRQLQFTYNGVNPYYENNGYGVFKFLHRTSWDMDQVLMRASEMYLIEAEAAAELGNDANARDTLNAIRNRAGATPVGSTVGGAALIDLIMLERRKELFGEGFRFFDMTRKSQPLVRFSISHWVPLNWVANDPRMVLPIPQDEIDANPNISESDQNEAYR